MATNKTINPTNVTVQIPAMTDKPNQSVNSNCIDKTIDGVNALDKKMYDLTATATGTVDGNVEAVIKAVRTHMKTNNLNEGTFRVIIGTVNSPMVTAQRWASGNRITGIVTYAYDTVYSFRINENDETISKEQLALNSNFESVANDKKIHQSALTSHQFNVPNNSFNLFMFASSGASRNYVASVYKASGDITLNEISKGNNVTVSTSGSTLTVTLDAAYTCDVRTVNVYGDSITG